jgi:dihydrofolate synthase/folylpolyglutamate synthase
MATSSSAAPSEGSADGMAEVLGELAERWPENRIGPSLTRIAMLCDVLGSPERAAPAIKVVGTNGKTSTARLIESLLRATGLRTGLYTSPHLRSPTERIAVDGEPISEDRFVQTYSDVAPFVDMVDAQAADSEDGHRMTYFEVLTGMAFACFADAPTSVSVLEAGMGGSWDATNVAPGHVCVLTPVGLDHTEYLGPDLASIASEKVGVLASGGLLVSADQDPAVVRVVEEHAARVGASVLMQGRDFDVVRRDVAVGGQLLTIRGIAATYEDVFLSLHGEHQAGNLALAVAAVEAFIGGGRQAIDADVLAEAAAMAAIPGRLEVVRREPTVLLDGAHNPAGARALAQALGEEFTFGRLVGVLGVLAGKDMIGVMEALEPVLDHVVVTAPLSPRAVDPAAVARHARDVFGEERVSEVASLDDALVAALAEAEDGAQLGLASGVVVTGSVVTVGQARTLLGEG